MYDYIIVGAGISGSVLARSLAEKEKKILLVEKRNHIAGNIYDLKNDIGILVQKYGPHIFHTNIQEVWTFLKKFGKWNDYYLKCMVFMNGKYTPSPFNFQTIDDYFTEEKAKEIKDHIAKIYGNASKSTIIDMLNSEDNVIRQYANFLFENDYSLYTAKQWGIKPNEIDVSVLKRVPVLFSYKNGYFEDKYQAMPENGFTKIVENILNHQNITVKLNVNAKDKIVIDLQRKQTLYENKKMPLVWTGALDELFDFKYGKLPYRSLCFKWKTFDKDSYQEAPVVAYPQENGYTRITEYKKLPFQNVPGKTTVAFEYPLMIDEKNIAEPYYPIPTEQNQKMYQKYRADADQLENLTLCGRLAEYRYYNMDQAVFNALKISRNIRTRTWTHYL
ncbi:UDP-galactopyranose mutase [Treponema pedis]|uniref:UDP-galactopyranose mutase n=1 Tax=Treponema pedis TaxID=409322 RepID=UPI0003F715DF|nr:UDP-galactopyranose mutase [Treponema pedis]